MPVCCPSMLMYATLSICAGVHALVPGVGPATLYIALHSFLGDLMDARFGSGTKSLRSPVCHSKAGGPAVGACPTSCVFLRPVDHPALCDKAPAVMSEDDRERQAVFVPGIPAPPLYRPQYSLLCGTDLPATLYPVEVLHVRVHLPADTEWHCC